MSSRRTFLKNIAMTSTAGIWSQVTSWADVEKLIKPLQADEEDFWGWVRMQYTVSANMINLNNGGVSPQPKSVQEALFRYTEMANQAPSYYLWRVLDEGKEQVRRKLADIIRVSSDEVAINRNTTESLMTVIHGLNLKKGDEVVLSKYDYPRMMNAWKAREKKDGIVLKWIDFDFPENDPKLLIQKYVSAFTSKTKVVHLTHLINWVGQILPVKEIAIEAHKAGITTILDAAHTFAHIDFSLSEGYIDFMGASLHKWLCAPFGTGILYIRKQEIENIPTFFTEDPSMKPTNIRKFEELGTRASTSELAISDAIDFHNIIGIKRKQRRLYELKQYWTNQVKDEPGVSILTPENEKLSGAIALVAIHGKDATEIESFLYSKYKIHSVSIHYEALNGVRISPNVYTSEYELDMLVEGIKTLAKS